MPVLTIRFGPFLLDSDTRQLARDGAAIRVSPKAFDLLAALIQERPKIVSKALLQERLWPATFVAEANLSNLVAEVRKALGDPPRASSFIRTAHGFGYAFCGDAETVEDSREAQPIHASCWLEWRGRRYPLPAGEHVIGRDADAAIRLDAPTVSRRHARVVVTGEDVVLEDFDSKNGTYRGADRVTSPIQLVDGDAIRIGSLVLTFHRHGRLSTETQAHPAG